MTDTSGSPPRAASGVRPGVVLAAVLAVVAAAHSRSIEGPFVWDDRPLIAMNPAVHQVDVREYFLAAFWHATPDDQANPVYYRPITTLSNALDWQAWSGRPYGFHVTNILLHLAVCALVFVLSRQWGASPESAALAAMLFGVLPRLTESVSWISGRTDVLAAMFALGAMLLHGSSPGSSARRIGAALLLLGGMLSKEVAIAGVAAIVVLEWRRAANFRGLLQRWTCLLPAIFATGVYLALRWHALHLVPSPSHLGKYPAGVDRFATIVEAVGWYALMLVDPLRPRTQVGLLFFPSALAVAVGTASLALIAAMAARWARRPPAPEVAAALALAAAALALVVHIVPLRVQVVAADRFLYVPAAGLAIAGAISLPATMSQRARRAAAWLGLVLVAVFGTATYARSVDWTDEVRLWEKTIATSPRENALPQTQYAHALRRAGRLEEAVVALDDIAARARDETTRLAAETNAAIALADLDRLDEAAAHMRAAAASPAAAALEYYNLALIEAKMLRFDAAVAAIDTALRLHPDYADASHARSVIVAAREGWLALPQPGMDESAPTRAARASIYARLGASRRAARMWVGVIQSSDLPQAMLLEGIDYVARYGTLDDAREAAERARAAGVRPDFAASIESLIKSRSQEEYTR